jgi:hypothetical protein
MSPLALACYTVLRLLVPSAWNPRLAYTDLIARLPAEFQYLDMRDPHHRNVLSTALGEIVEACRRHDLPPLPAIVVRREGDQLTTPGSGYYEAAHPTVQDEIQRLVLWGQDFEAVRRTAYPERL